jgi:UDP-3-O-[3-hydroxymyristoyl] glucosamine N-acyltransferase
MKFWKKYEINSDGRVVALRNFGNVKKGDIGGFVDGYHNLSQWGNCWVYYGAQVREKARLKRHAIAFGNAEISGRAVMTDHSRASHNAKVSGHARMSKHSIACSNTMIYGHAHLAGYFIAGGNSKIYMHATCGGDASALGNSRIFGRCDIGGRVCLYGNVEVYDCPTLRGQWKIGGYAVIIRDCKKHPPINLSGPAPSITITDNHIYICSAIHKISEWFDFTSNQIDSLRVVQRNAWFQWKGKIWSHCEITGRSV